MYEYKEFDELTKLIIGEVDVAESQGMNQTAVMEEFQEEDAAVCQKDAALSSKDENDADNAVEVEPQENERREEAKIVGIFVVGWAVQYISKYVDFFLDLSHGIFTGIPVYISPLGWLICKIVGVIKGTMANLQSLPQEEATMQIMLWMLHVSIGLLPIAIMMLLIRRTLKGLS